MTVRDNPITLVEGAIHNPSDSRHFMRISRPDHLITAVVAGTKIARSTNAIKVKEVGFDIYDPVIYFPRTDVEMEYLTKNKKSTHCPLKGDTEYFDATVAIGRIESAAWSYDRAIDVAKEIEGYIGFDVRHTVIVEYTDITVSDSDGPPF